MCGRYELSSHPAAIALAFGLPHPPDIAAALQHRAHAAGADRPAERGRRARARAGALGPRAALGEGSGDRRADDQRARRDARRSKSAFRNAYARHRCLLPVNGFYEWQVDARGQAADAHRHAGRRGRSASAGLYERWLSPEGEVLDTCTIVTTSASDSLRAVHERMPVIVPAPHYARWLDARERRRRRPRSRRGPASRCASIRCRRASTRCATTMRGSAIQSTSPLRRGTESSRSRSSRSEPTTLPRKTKHRCRRASSSAR